MTKRKPGIRPIGDNRTVRIASQRRAEPDLQLFAQAVAETLIITLGREPIEGDSKSKPAIATNDDRL